MAVDNNTIIGDFLLRNTNDAQQLGLSSTMQGLSQGMQQIFDPVKGDIYNHFCDCQSVVNRNSTMKRASNQFQVRTSTNI